MKVYVLIHTQGNVETAHGYYDNMRSANNKIEQLIEQEIELQSDNIKVYEIDIDKVEKENETKLENLDICDVAYEGKLVRKYGIVTSWYWDEEEVAE